MTDLRTAAQQALEALEWHLERGAYGADIEGVTGNLRAALAQQAEPVEPVAKVAAAQVEAERERIFAHIRSAMGHAEAGYGNVAWRLLASLVGPNAANEGPFTALPCPVPLHWLVRGPWPKQEDA